MLIEARKPAYLDPRPRSFAALMDLYEANYIRLRQLSPELRSQRGALVSRVAGAMDLYLEVIESCPYTTTLILTYHFEGDEGRHRRKSPNLHLRVYHDARQVEVMGCACRRSGEEVSLGDHPDWQALEHRWRFNRFLYKWLGYCLHQGHRFEGAGAAAKNS
ncbi:hypothetical protein ECTPHS_05040 [Ectothiorhodospira sp. PHS-1]|uniref:DUF1249 domain-containing protein n=1 Tax=Ectothiorhodospira sp. PHS-1 TaxID=519989 RepID=UPI00024A8121|nr:DUF1249 domain-containing protein [Ectothiorhodospira sp. PHS-1]EHQ52035.1 hypothetical protein ECTPHS_05040 [Ectothiorhodospira sp. PHS-1]